MVQDGGGLEPAILHYSGEYSSYCTVAFSSKFFDHCVSGCVQVVTQGVTRSARFTVVADVTGSASPASISAQIMNVTISAS